jgi:hypothetical protein
MPVDPNVLSLGTPDQRLAERLAALERKVAAMERQQVATIIVPDGIRLRVEFGKTASGRYGLRVYDNGGNLVHDFTTDA